MRLTYTFILVIIFTVCSWTANVNNALSIRYEDSHCNYYIKCGYRCYEEDTLVDWRHRPLDWFPQRAIHGKWKDCGFFGFNCKTCRPNMDWWQQLGWCWDGYKQHMIERCQSRTPKCKRYPGSGRTVLNKAIIVHPTVRAVKEDTVLEDPRKHSYRFVEDCE